MATIYKVEIELTSHWVNYTPVAIEKMLKEAIENNYDANHPHNEIDIQSVEAERTS